MTTEAQDLANTASAQAEWDAVAKERETGEVAAEKPPVEPVTTDPAVDPLAEIRSLIDKIDHRTKSTEGRIGALDKSMQQAMQAASKAATKQGIDAPTQARVTEAMKTPEGWERLRAENPEFVKIQEEFLEAKLAHERGLQLDTAAIDRIVSERVAEQSAANRTEMIDSHLDSLVSNGNWREEINTSEFSKWFSAQPPEVQALSQSSKMTDAAKMIRLYESSKTQTTAANQLTQQRQQTLESAAGAPTRSQKVPKPLSVEDMTPEQLWNHEAKLREKKRERGY